VIGSISLRRLSLRNLYNFPTHSLRRKDSHKGNGAAGKNARLIYRSTPIMWDLGCLIASAAFFLITIAYIEGCDRLSAKETR
jgi:hypothetical protein